MPTEQVISGFSVIHMDMWTNVQVTSKALEQIREFKEFSTARRAWWHNPATHIPSLTYRTPPCADALVPEAHRNCDGSAPRPHSPDKATRGAVRAMPVHSGLMNHNTPEARCHTEAPGTKQVLSRCDFPFPRKDVALM